MQNALAPCLLNPSLGGIGLLVHDTLQTGDLVMQALLPSMHAPLSISR